MNYDWVWFRDAIQGTVNLSEKLDNKLLRNIQKFDSIVGTILNRETSFTSKKPQDYVVSILITRAYRLTISSLYISLGGYPDSGINLQRTVWEIGIRLLDIDSAPVPASLGYLLDGCANEIKSLKTEFEYRNNLGQTNNLLKQNLDNLQTHYNQIEQIAIKQGYDAEKIRNKHGKLNIRNVCKKFNIEKDYLVSFSFSSGYVHEKNIATNDFMTENKNERKFELGPVEASGGPISVILDDYSNLLNVLTIAAKILGDQKLIEEVKNLFSNFK